MKIQNKFDVPASPEQAWSILLDVPGIVGCVPGAELISREAENVYKGRVSVKLGPVALKFNGTAAIEEADPATRTALIRANGADQQGRGNAGATTTMTVEPSEAGSTVTLDTDLQLSGLVAQYGRASGVINAVSSTIISQFAENLKRQMSATGEAEATDAAAAPSGADRPAQNDNALGGAMVWKIFVNWFRSLFGSSKRS
ncbi:SRPBCC family protein [Pelagibacterium lacus]|uniref:SRPBCC family protein n=1 Tax=Pelagibacterium lacus TaxID=2282655 RepID=UPI001314129F|nr:SRPBCC family protein [Pelagibacterium lacus]